MATCKDCIHEKACKEMLEATGFEISVDYKGNADRCDTFITKEDVVPVVRCEQCRKRYTTECALWFSQLDDKQYFCGAIHNDDFYCSYGEREKE